MHLTLLASQLAIATAAFAALWLALSRWMRGRSDVSIMQLAAQEPQVALTSLRYSLDVILGPSGWSKRRLFRSFAVSSLLLLFVLGITGLLKGNFLGIEQAPWTAYQVQVEQLIKTNRLQYERAKTGEEKARAKVAIDLTTRFTAPWWKYLYAAELIVGVLVTNFLMLLREMAKTRHFLLEHQEARSLTQKASVLFTCACISFAAGLFLLPWLSLLASPLGFIPLLAFLLFHNWVWIFAALVVSLALEWTLAGVWLKATVLTVLLPSIGLLALAMHAVLEKITAAILRRPEQVAQGWGLHMRALLVLFLTLGLVCWLVTVLF
jgi:hypothetical protein